MKICFVCNEYPPDRHGGIGSFVHDLATELVAMGHEIWVIGFSDRNFVGCEEGVNVVRIWHKKQAGIIDSLWRRWYLSRKVRCYARRHSFDLVEVPEYEGELPFFNWPFTAACKLVVRYHMSQTIIARLKGEMVSRLIAWFESLQITQADYRIAVSEHVSRKVVDVFSAKAAPDRVIYNFVDVNVFEPVENVVRDKNRILLLGSISYIKGTDLFFAALPEIFRSNPYAYLDIVGFDSNQGPNGSSLLKHLISELPDEFQSRVNYHGRVERNKLPAIYSGAGCCVFPSRVEAHSIAWLEAMACGCPCVLSEIAGGREYVINNQAALVCNPANSSELYESVCRLLNDDPLRSKLQYNSRIEIQSRFSKQSQVKVNLAFYADVNK
ncbi:MAG: glycosyltransferase family 4 protein [Sedimentisphaerales bacterium]|nr:glycosyltransferase family 4 protein [Sedimentisphaerales bacterium]